MFENLPQSQPPQPPRTHRVRAFVIAGLALAVIVITGIAVAASGSPGPAHRAATTAPAVTAPASTQPATTAPAPTPSPDGTFQGSCDYILSASLGGADHLVGEVDVTNTGNIGLVLRVKITWPQEGYPPVAMHRTVRVAYGATKAVRFRMIAGQSVIDLLQSWQGSHDFKDGCTYKTAFTGTFGNAH